MLEHHAHLGADLFNIFQIVGKLGAVDDDAAPLMFLQAVYAADQR